MNVFLPKTNFNLYIDAKGSEKEILNFWQKINLAEKRKNARAGAQNFVLHDGPPYANGPIHLGHAENKFWKDALNKIFWQHGYSTPYIPGWDSHGLPIETAVEKELKASNLDKNTLSRTEFWDRCYEFSKHWMEVQKEQFKNLGVFADYENAYAMFFEPESLGIVECIHKFVSANLLERRFKPVLWSYAEKTALAYAEVEYKDKTSNSIYLAFPVLETDIQQLENASLIIWTTTPWTIPANEAIAYNANFEYIIFEAAGKKYCILENLFKNVAQEFPEYKVLAKISGTQFANTKIDHALKEFQYAQTGKYRRMLHADFVEDQKGTGFVHIAPSNGEDDYNLGKANNLNIEDYLDSAGCYKDNIPLVGKFSVKDADKIIIEAAQNQGVAIKIEQIVHSYPHSWRSKAPLIYRLTSQWFLKIDPIKKKALEALKNMDEDSWVPKEGRNRLVSMVEAREDWCVSRQRIWGVPMAIFFNEESGQILDDPAFLEKTRNKLAEIGVKNWWNLNIADIDKKYENGNWKRLDDIIEIWFESGSTQYFVLQKKNLFPCDVYLEGSDQHRGWFQSSLLISAFLTGKAPWKHLLTHGFCLDGTKQKMSKSLGNVINPADWSADHLRLFFATSNLCHDISMNENSIKNSQEMLFRFRNTMKFILGMLAVESQHKKVSKIDENEYEQLPYEKWPILEKWLLHKITLLDKEYDEILQTFQIQHFAMNLYEFCAQDLSAFYFDVRKDTLYCDKIDNLKRMAAISCLRAIAPILIKWFAPIMPFFAEEAWQIYLSENNIENAEESVHMAAKSQMPEYYSNNEAYGQLEKLREIRKKITESIEKLREQKTINTTNEAMVYLPHDLYSPELKDLAIVSSVNEANGEANEIRVEKAAGSKCPRCRFIYEILNGEFCPRCAKLEKSEH